MWAPALRFLAVTAASAAVGWLGSTYLRRREAEADTVPPPAGRHQMARDERPVRTLAWCETCHAHMPLEHSCDLAGVRKATVNTTSPLTAS